ncbi:MAG: transporter substrate-binding domain-containing protein [Nitrospirales bacterium]|nr:transporter substrate-binding domain-containing protein [Nitrospirales bacterium]
MEGYFTSVIEEQHRHYHRRHGDYTTTRPQSEFQSSLRRLRNRVSNQYDTYEKFTGLNNLNQPNTKIAVVAGTVAEGLAQRIFPKTTIKIFQKSAEAIQAVTQGTVHAYVEHNPIPTFIALDHPQKVDEPLSKPLLTTKSGFAVNKGSFDFINFLNAWITTSRCLAHFCA